MKFSDRYEYNEVFEQWCKSLKYGYAACHDVPPTVMNAIYWMESTPEGQEMVKRLYQEIWQEANK